MVFYNASNAIGAALVSSISLTGSLFLSLLFIVFFFFVVAALFRIPLEFTVILLLPLLIVAAVSTSQIMSVLGVALIWVAVIFAKNFITVTK